MFLIQCKCQLEGQLQHNHGNTPDKNNGTALWLAASRGQVGAIRELLDNGASIKGDDTYNRTVLHIAALKGRAEVAKELLSHKAVIDAIDARDIDGKTALHWASSGGHVEVAKELLSHGASTDAMDEDGNTPLALAIWLGHVESNQGITRPWRQHQCKG